MINGIVSAQHVRCSNCEVCGCELSHLDTLKSNPVDYSVCRSFDCIRIMQQKTYMGPAAFKAFLEFKKKLIRQGREKSAARARYINEVTKKQQQEDREILASVIYDYPEFTEENTHILGISSGYSKVSSLLGIRVNKYIEHLNYIISEAGKYSNASEVIYDEHHAASEKIRRVEKIFHDAPSLRTISDRLCGMCKGGCCAKGKEQAYLSVFSIRRYMDNHSELSAEDILDLYLSRISSVTIENSCINHTETGCALPRQLRSDICNGFYCDSLKAYQKKMAGKENPGRVLVIQRSGTNWDRFEPGAYTGIVSVALLDYSDD